MHIAYQIIADNVDVTQKFLDRLVRLTIIDEAGHKSDTAEIEVDDRDHLVSLPQTGAILKIALGFVGNLVELGTYVVDEVSGEIAPATLMISAKAADMMGSIKARKTRSWHDVTVNDIVDKIAGEHGLKPQISDSLKPHAYSYLAQTSESDLNFLTRLAKDLDAISKPAGGYLLFAKRGDGKATNGSELPVFKLHRTQMAGGSWKVTSRSKYGRVIAEWAERATATVHKVQAGNKTPELVLRHRYASEAEARQAATSALERSQRASGRISIQLGGFHGDLMAGAKINLKDIKPELTGEWLITRVQHRLTDTLTTSLDAERDNGKDKQ